MKHKVWWFINRFISPEFNYYQEDKTQLLNWLTNVGNIS